MLSLGIAMLLAVWRSHAAGLLSASWEAMFWCAGATVVNQGRGVLRWFRAARSLSVVR